MAYLHMRSKKTGSVWPGFLVGSGLFLLAGWFVCGPDLVEIPSARSMPVPPSLLSTNPLRTPLGDPPFVRIGVFEYTCMDCHILFPPRADPPVLLLQHRHIKMEHGINDRCRNCHDVIDRDRLVLQSGKSIPFGKVNTLCSNCHGPVFRDWERGMHGRTNGYWNTALGEQHRLGCTECHDPHHPRTPAMEPITPLAPPNTLRMHPLPGTEQVEVKERDPLRQALERDEAIQHDPVKHDPVKEEKF